MKVYDLSYAMTKRGIRVFCGVRLENGFYRGGHGDGYLSATGPAMIALTQDEAIDKFDDMRDKKIKSLVKQIARLREMGPKFVEMPVTEEDKE